jgi:hypothetical protein
MYMYRGTGKFLRREAGTMVLGLMSLLKGLQLLPNGMGGAMMSLDCIHGQVRRDFKEKMGFPGWFPTVLGLFKLTQAVLNWVADGAYVPVAQGLMAFQMGGVLFTHTIAEKPDGKSFMEKNAPAAVFFGTTLAIQSLHGKLDFTTALVAHLIVGALGFCSGYIILALGSGTEPALAAVASPDKKRR